MNTSYKSEVGPPAPLSPIVFYAAAIAALCSLLSACLSEWEREVA